MNKKSRMCNQEGHEHFSPYLFCTFDQCKVLSRWCCIQCITQQLHDHGFQDQAHIISEQALKTKLISYDKIQQEVKQIISPLVNSFKTLEKSFYEMKDEIQKSLLNLNSYEDQLELQSYIQEFENSNLIDDHKLLDYYNKNEQISKISNLSQIQYYFESLQQQFYQFELQLKDCSLKQERYQNQTKLYDQEQLQNQNKSNVLNHAKRLSFFNSQTQNKQVQQAQPQIQTQSSLKLQEFLKKQSDYSTDEYTQRRQLTLQRQQIPWLQKQSSAIQQINQFQSFQADQSRSQAYREQNQDKNNQTIKYGFVEIDKTNKYCYNATSISNNELYLAYGGSENILKIFSLKEDRIIKEFQLIKSIICCQFTDDSSRLFVGSQKFVYGFDSKNNFNLIYQQAIHLHWVSSIVTIQNQYIITCSADKTIIKTDIMTKQQIFRLVGHTSYVKTIDYNDKDDIIISGSTDKSIKLWNCKTKNIIIDKLQSHENDIIQLQLTNNKENILSLDRSGQLYNWKIDLMNKNLIKIQELIDLNKIYTFYQVNQGQNLIIVCNKYVKILKNNLDVVSIINHDCVEYVSDRDSKQLDNMKYIIIRGSRTILLGRIIEN